MLAQSQRLIMFALLRKRMACMSTLSAIPALQPTTTSYSPVVLHSDHCAHKLLPWFDGMLAEDKKYFDQHGEALFSSHMLDLSEESKEENIKICAEYFAKMAPLGMFSACDAY